MAQDSFHSKKTLTVGKETYHYQSLPAAAENGLGEFKRLPKTLKILLENLLRFEDGESVTRADIEAIVAWQKTASSTHEIAYHPARVLMQDFTGVPAVVDLAAMRDAIKTLGGDPNKINPINPVDLVIDHSVQVDDYASAHAFKDNVEHEMARNLERYQFLRWGQSAFENFHVVPPGTGICHQVNLEFLAQGVWTGKNAQGECLAYPDTLVGTDSHTTMVNGLGVLGWGVGGIEAEAAMLGQAISMLIPEVVGFELTGKLPEGITATDLVLTITQMLRAHGVVGKFVEYFGEGLQQLSLADRATIANMAPEYGATCGFFPIDHITLDYLRMSNRDQAVIERVETYAKVQGLWHDHREETPIFSSTLKLDLSSIEPCLAGPKRPQDRVALKAVPNAFQDFLLKTTQAEAKHKRLPIAGSEASLTQGAVVIAAITSCTNTSNPSVLMAAGLLAKKAVEKGLLTKPWVKTSLAPGSKVVTAYLEKAGLQSYLDQLGFNLVGYGCTTCIGNSGPLREPIAQAIIQGDLTVSAVLSGNRNFEGRVHPLVKANWLASPPLVVAYALAGSTTLDLSSDPLGHNAKGEPIYLKDIWPSNHEISEAVLSVTQTLFQREYADVFSGDAHWQAIQIEKSDNYNWPDSTYVRNPPFFENMPKKPAPITSIENARILAILGDSITTDHISPAGAIKTDSPAGKYLQAQGVQPKDFNSYGARRGNHEVMMRGTFANIRIKNEMVPGTEGGLTCYYPDKTTMPIYDAAMAYQAKQIPLIIFAGKEYGTGSSRDWAAKGTLLLGVKAVIAESFERIHRSNLIGMGVLPFEFMPGTTRHTLNLRGDEHINLNLPSDLKPGMTLKLVITHPETGSNTVLVKLRIDTATELAYYENGGILHYVLRQLAQG